MKKNKVLKTGVVLFIVTIIALVTFNKTKVTEESLFSNNIEALATGEGSSSFCETGFGYCEDNGVVVYGLKIKN